MTQEALKLALEALEQTLKTLDDENAKPGGAIADTIWHSEYETLFDYLGSKITAIKEALAQPEQEPVGTVSVETKNDRRTYQFTATKRLPDGILDIYTAPPQRKPLTDEEIAETLGFGEHTTATTRAILTHAARAIEAKLKERNT